jgi:hypothetical protein
MSTIIKSSIFLDYIENYFFSPEKVEEHLMKKLNVVSQNKL